VKYENPCDGQARAKKNPDHVPSPPSPLMAVENWRDAIFVPLINKWDFELHVMLF
jgi:hypothetical protein